MIEITESQSRKKHKIVEEMDLQEVIKRVSEIEERLNNDSPSSRQRKES